MATPNPPLKDLPHVTPVRCPACENGNAHLVWRSPEAFKREGDSEVWVFKCDACGRETRQLVDK